RSSSSSSSRREARSRLTGCLATEPGSSTRAATTPLRSRSSEGMARGRSRLDPADLPDVLLHIEGRAAGLGLQEIEFQLPGPNEVAARHLLSRGFRIDPWVNLLMSDRPFGKFDRILGFGPPLFL